MIIDVTQADIDAANADLFPRDPAVQAKPRCQVCPVAQAFCRIFGFPIRVNGVEAYYETELGWHSWDIPADAQEKIFGYDADKGMTPFSFIIADHPTFEPKFPTMDLQVST